MRCSLVSTSYGIGRLAILCGRSGDTFRIFYMISNHSLIIQGRSMGAMNSACPKTSRVLFSVEAAPITALGALDRTLGVQDTVGTEQGPPRPPSPPARPTTHQAHAEHSQGGPRVERGGRGAEFRLDPPRMRVHPQSPPKIHPPGPPRSTQAAGGGERGKGRRGGTWGAPKIHLMGTQVGRRVGGSMGGGWVG